MLDRNTLEETFIQHGFTDFKWMRAEDFEVAQWVRMKCIFGCDSYGKKGTCPPQTPSVAECREFFSDYKHAIIFHFEKIVDRPEERIPWSRNENTRLIKLEREIFLSGFYKAFLLTMDECRLCKDCTGSRNECVNPKMARPSAESMAVDVYATVRKYGYNIAPVKNYHEPMNRYAFLLVE